MAAITATRTSNGPIHRWAGTSASNSADTLTATIGTRQRMKVKYVTCHYDIAPTQAGVTVTLDSSAGALFDTLLTTGSANAQNTVYIPTQDTLVLINGDAIVVAAPAGGAGAEASIVVVMEQA